MPNSDPARPAVNNAKRYQAVKNRLFLFSLLLQFVFLIGIVATGLSERLRAQAAALAPGFLSLNALYFSVFCAAAFFFSLPLEYYEGYVLEHRFGLSRQSATAWFADLLKKCLVFFIVSLVLVEGLYVFLLRSPDTWWVWATLLWFFVSVVLSRVFPKVILPLFFKSTPLSAGALRERIFALLGRYKVRLKDVFVLDLSKKTVKANAMVAGLGATKQIFLSDTLIQDFPVEEIEAVLAHELGHYLHKDTLKIAASSLVTGAVSFYLAHRALGFLVPFFGFGAVSDIAGLPLLLAVLLAAGLVLLPSSNAFSRFLEKNADRFALLATRDAGHFISMMERLGARNLADLAPSRITEIFLYDHPPIQKRIRMAQEMERQHGF